MEAVTKIIELPRGSAPARLDDKGRLKLPVGFQEYFRDLPEKKLFVTSINRRTAQVYTIDTWRQNEKTLSEFKGDPNASRRVAMLASHYGAESEMDGQGRILFPTEMRRELGIENQSVRLVPYRGHIEVMTDAMYEEEMRKVFAEFTPGDVEAMENAGLQ